MTEKRFNIEYVQGNPTIFHIVDDGKHIDEMKIVDLLNGYYESNKNLYNNYMRLMEENEQLKSENQELKQYLSWQDMELEEMEDLND